MGPMPTTCISLRSHHGTPLHTSTNFITRSFTQKVYIVPYFRTRLHAEGVEGEKQEYKTKLVSQRVLTLPF